MLRGRFVDYSYDVHTHDKACFALLVHGAIRIKMRGTEFVARAAAGLPPFRLFRAFERAIGMSPHTYQRQARIRFATGLIKLGHPLRDVAAASGFADQAHLTRSFRRTLGVTPGGLIAALSEREIWRPTEIGDRAFAKPRQRVSLPHPGAGSAERSG